MPRHPADHIPTDFGPFDIDPREPIVPQLYAQLRGKILSLKLKPGDPVSESELAAASGVSRTPARQVIKQLVSENLLVAFSSRGTYVSKIDTHRLKEALFIRSVLEPALARQCALEDSRGELVTALRQILEGHRAALAAGSVEDAYRIDAAFHKTICTRGGEGLVWQTIRQARTEADRLQTLSRNRSDSLQNALGQHERIIEAIEAGDGDRAFRAMEEHMKSNEEAFAQILEENPELFSD